MRKYIENLWAPGTGIRLYALVGWTAALLLAVTR